MDKISITIASPHRQDFCAEYVTSLALTLIDGRYNYFYRAHRGTVIHHNRNIIARDFLEGESDFLLFADTDEFWIPGDIQTLVEADKDICVGFILNKTIPATTPIMQLTDFQEDYEKGEPVEILSSGCGFMLIKREVLTAFFKAGVWPFDPLPWADVDDEVVCGCSYGAFPSGLYWEDHSFCYKARKFGFKIWCVPSVQIGHVGNVAFMSRDSLEHWEAATKELCPYTAPKLFQ